MLVAWCKEDYADSDIICTCVSDCPDDHVTLFKGVHDRQCISGSVCAALAVVYAVTY